MPGIFTNFWSIQLIGAIALLFSIFAWNAATRNKILWLQGISSLIFVIHYYLLSAYTGALLSLVVVVRNYIFNKRGKNSWANNQAWMYLFMLTSIVILAASWQGWISILPVAGVIIGTYAIRKDNPSDIRFYMLLTALVWMPYTIIVQSYSGLISQIVSSLAIIIGMSRLDRAKGSNSVP